MADSLVELIRGPITFTALASTYIEAGCIVGTAWSQDVVTSSGKSSLADADIRVLDTIAALSTIAIGIALTQANTGAYLTVSTGGLYIVRSAAAIKPGARLVADASDAQEFTPFTNSFTVVNIGRALTGASNANKYIVANLNFA